MDDFVVSDRVPRAAPRLARADAADRDAAADQHQGPVIELADIRIAEPLGDRLATLRDRWSELTFYLFDTQSWR